MHVTEQTRTMTRARRTHCDIIAARRMSIPMLLLALVLAAVSVAAQTLTPGAFPSVLYLGGSHSASIVASAAATTPGLVVHLDCGGSVVVTPASRCLAAGGTLSFALQTAPDAVADATGDACVFYVDSEFTFAGSATSGAIPRVERGPLDVFPESSVDVPITAYVFAGLNAPVAIVRLTPQDAPLSTVTPSMTCSDLATLHGEIRPGSYPNWPATDKTTIAFNVITATAFDGIGSIIRCVWNIAGPEALRYLPIADSYFKLTRPELLNVDGVPDPAVLVAPGTSLTIVMAKPVSLPAASKHVRFTLVCTSNGANPLNVLSFLWDPSSLMQHSGTFPVVNPAQPELSVLHECRWVVTGNDDQASKYTVAQPSFRFVVGNPQTIQAPSNVLVTSASHPLSITATAGSLREPTNVTVVCTGEATPDNAAAGTTSHTVVLSPGTNSGSFDYVRRPFVGDPATPVVHKCSLQLDPASSDAPHFSVQLQAHIFVWGSLRAFNLSVFPVAAEPLIFDIKGLPSGADAVVARIAAPLPPSTPQSVDVRAPVAVGASTYAASFTLGLTCTYGALSTVLVSSTLTWDTPSTPSLAQSIAFTTPAIPGVGEGVEVSCVWLVGGTPSEAAKYAQPPPFNFWVGTTVQLVASVANPGAPILVGSTVALNIVASSDATAAAPTNLWLRCGSCGDSGMISFSGPVVLDRAGGAVTPLNTAALSLTTTRVGRVNCSFSFSAAAVAGEDARHFLVPAPLVLTVAARFRPTPKGIPTATDSIVSLSIDAPVAVSTTYTISIARPQFQVGSGLTLTFQLSCSAGSPILSNAGLITFDNANTAPAGQPASQSFTLTTTSTPGALYRCSWTVGGDAAEQVRSASFVASSFEFQAAAANPAAHVLAHAPPTGLLYAGAWSDPITLSTSDNVVVGAQGLTLRAQCTGSNLALEVRSGSSSTPYAALVADGAGFLIDVPADAAVGPSTPLSYVFRAPLVGTGNATCDVEVVRGKLVAEQGAQWRLWSVASASVSVPPSSPSLLVTVAGDAITGPLSAAGQISTIAAIPFIPVGTTASLRLDCPGLQYAQTNFQPLSSAWFPMNVPTMQPGDTGNSYECEFFFDTSDSSNMGWSKFTLSHPAFTVRLGQSVLLSFATPLNFVPSSASPLTAIAGTTSDEFVMVASGCMSNLHIESSCFSVDTMLPVTSSIEFSTSLASSATLSAAATDIRFRFIALLTTTLGDVTCILKVNSTDHRSSFVFHPNADRQLAMHWRVESATSTLITTGLPLIRPRGAVTEFLIRPSANPIGGLTLALWCTDVTASPSRLFFPQTDGLLVPQSVTLSAIDSNYHETFCNFSVVSATPLPSGGAAQFGAGLLNVKLITGHMGEFTSTLTSAGQTVAAACGTTTFALTPTFPPEVDVQLQMECTSTGLSSASGQGLPLVSINGEWLLSFTFPHGSAAPRQFHVQPLGASNIKVICLFTSLTPGWIAPPPAPLSFGSPITVQVSGVPAGLRFGTVSTPISVTPDAVVPGDSAVNAGGVYTVFRHAHTQHTFSAPREARSPASRRLLTSPMVDPNAPAPLAVGDYLSVAGLVLLVSCNVGTPRPAVLHFPEGSQAPVSFTVQAPWTSTADVQIHCGFQSSGSQGFAFQELAPITLRSSMERALVFGGSLTSTMQLGATASLTVQPPHPVLLAYDVALSCLPAGAVTVSPPSVSFGVNATEPQEFTLVAGFEAGATTCSWAVSGDGRTIITPPVARSVIVVGTLPPSSSTAMECGATCAAVPRTGHSQWMLVATMIVGVAALMRSEL